MSMRNKVIAAVLATGALTAVASVNVLTATASQPAASPSSTAQAVAQQEGNIYLFAKLLQAELAISGDQALQVVRDIEGIVPKGDITQDPRFVAVAKGLGITPQRLIEAINAVKTKLSAGGSPTK